MKNIKLIEVKSEIGAGTRGSSMAVNAIKTAALDFGSSYFKRYSSVEIQNENWLLLEPIRNYHAKRIKGVYDVSSRVCKSVQDVIKEGSFPIVLAGDHSSAIGTIAGIKSSWPEKRLGIVWIDAHADIHTPYTTPSGNLHGMVLSAALGEDNLEQRINNPDEESIEYWEKLKNLGIPGPKISYEDLVLIAERDMEAQESFLIKKNKVKLVPVSEIRKKSTERIAIEALSYLEKCDVIYVSFDVDSIDPSVSKGTGTPVPNGISDKEAGNLIYYLLRSNKLCCFEIVEVNPTLDRENQMAETAFGILLKATNQLNNYF